MTTRTREVVMTVHAIQADLLDISTFGEPPSSQFVMGNVWVSARGGPDSHRWRLRDGERAWVGDRVTVTLIEDDPAEDEWGTADPPTDDRSTR